MQTLRARADTDVELVDAESKAAPSPTDAGSQLGPSEASSSVNSCSQHATGCKQNDAAAAGGVECGGNVTQARGGFTRLKDDVDGAQKRYTRSSWWPKLWRIGIIVLVVTGLNSAAASAHRVLPI